MDNTDSLAFAELFKEAYHKCFAQPLEKPLTETESKLFCTRVLDLTGLSIGWKSVKNYSFFITGSSGKEENPSIATLDTLARYVLGAPYSTEIQRKDNESHYPYWFLYKEKFNQASPKGTPANKRHYYLIVLGMVSLMILVIFWLRLQTGDAGQFSDDFKQGPGNSLAQDGWFLKDKDTAFWNRKNETKGQLTLFTLAGDNWPDPPNQQRIKNLLLHPVTFDCFTTEVHLNNFIPHGEWQQAGLLLLEDTTLTGKSVRLSLAFNDNFGGFKKSPEVLIQVISSLGNGFGKPEEIAHRPILSLDSAQNNPQIAQILQHTGLRIEKQGRKFRFLYSGGTKENGAFKEVASQELDIQPRYIGIFAIKGFRDSTAIVPVHFTFFRIAGNRCQ
jgi:hypothetical protein